jgi:hypothetical protein
MGQSRTQSTHDPESPLALRNGGRGSVEVAETFAM